MEKRWASLSLSFIISDGVVQKKTMNKRHQLNNRSVKKLTIILRINKKFQTLNQTKAQTMN